MAAKDAEWEEVVAAKVRYVVLCAVVCTDSWRRETMFIAQDEALAAKDAKLEQAMATVAAKVRRIVLVFDLL